jgi:hypothetical protein
MNFTIAGIALALSAAFGCWGGYKATRMHYELVISDQLKKAEVDRESDRLRKQAAAGQYEAWKATQRPKTITATREVEHAVETESWGSGAIPPSVRDALAAAAASTGSGVADAAVSAVPAASAADESGSGFGLRLGARLGFGLPSAAQSTR